MIHHLRPTLLWVMNQALLGEEEWNDPGSQEDLNKIVSNWHLAYQANAVDFLEVFHSQAGELLSCCGPRQIPNFPRLIALSLSQKPLSWKESVFQRSGTSLSREEPRHWVGHNVTQEAIQDAMETSGPDLQDH